ncbi:MAG: hypothetical protein ACKV2T_38225, partial [Kofleriaceae bacterium]
ASLWIWESLPALDGSAITNAAALIAPTDPCAPPSLAVETGGSPRSILVLSAAEIAESAARTDGRSLALR